MNLSSQQSCVEGTTIIIIPVLQWRSLEAHGIWEIAQGRPAFQWWNRDSDVGSLVLEAILCYIACMFHAI